MLFGVKLANQIYPPWKDSYMDYEKLKKLLKESVIGQADITGRKSNRRNDTWSEKDESEFVSALDAELEKVYGFQSSKYNSIMEKLVNLEHQTDDEEAIKTLDFKGFQHVLEGSLSEAQELDNFCRVNYTGFIKIVKKHDKLHPKYPSVKSLLQVRLKELPFNSEEYSPLLYKISFLYNILRTNSPTVSSSLANSTKLSSVNNHEESSFQSYTFWIHPDNLMEVKTRILRHLPVLVYASPPNENSDLVDRLESSVMNSDVNFNAPSASSSTSEVSSDAKSYDPVVRTIYFDNEALELYNNKLLKSSSNPTLRLRWSGKLANKPDIFLEKRTLVEDRTTGYTDFEETRIKLKPKFINGFIFNGDQEYKEKSLKKLKDRGSADAEADKLSNKFDGIQQFVLENELQPVLRAMYTRTAFQIPGDDRVRISIDSDLMFIREDSFDENKPIRDPKSWHRADIDANIPNPLKYLRTGEYSKFPYAILDIRIRDPITESTKKNKDNLHAQLPGKHSQWVEELTNSHLVKEVANFSKYAQGVASLFGEDESLDLLPFWLPDLETDIRKDPKQAYEEEKKKLEEQKANQARVAKLKRLSVVQGSESFSTKSSPTDASKFELREPDLEDPESSSDEATESAPGARRRKRNANFLDLLVGRNSKLANVDSEDEEVLLPPGVKKPTSYLKNAGPVKVEAKVWLANERTFNRWLSLTTLMSVLTFSIYNSVSRAQHPDLAKFVAYTYFGITIFTGFWSYHTYNRRLNVIRARSGKHLDAPLGPLLVASVVVITLVVNFVLAFKDAAQKSRGGVSSTSAEEDSKLPALAELVRGLVFSLVSSQDS
ncbi:LADA_0A06700g1_1 [Lachancea dasiensis]|uniref:LADA_0A06700g1_1 n=1 Tax=Lachancea dasiensis TaxID=1072105 RepID=A0A1G4IPK6_9SACH|nr:LADA_0A06700g1_1 [Lachancea dasiensis]